ncbi:MAG TPA: XylR family transcriptional regulator [Verrucomicrobiae bacterium]|nr:XylR family transcriptional regulator [Verrucomicrobiae bacterium]
MRQPPSIPHIALLVETSREYGRGLLRGIIRYQREHGPWSIYFKPHGLGEPPPSWLAAWRGDGILARINDRRMARAVLRTGVPAIDLRSALHDAGVPIVGIDTLSVVRLAVGHFLDRAFRHFGFCGTPYGEHRYQDERSDQFARMVAARGFRCDVYQHPRPLPTSWEQEQNHIAGWLRALPKPVAVMACHDDRGQQVLDACLRAGLAVPDEVAVLGVDNDPFLCNLTTPPLSSIDVNPDRIGYEAAALLDRLMRGRKPPRRPHLIEARGLVVRQSTDITAVDDAQVARSVRLIREHACEGLGVGGLLGDVPVSRSALFRRFKEALGRSPKDEMTRVRLERAKELLCETHLPVAEVAGRVGYRESKYFIQVFHRIVGITPLRYRKILGRI